MGLGLDCNGDEHLLASDYKILNGCERVGDHRDHGHI